MKEEQDKLNRLLVVQSMIAAGSGNENLAEIIENKVVGESVAEICKEIVKDWI